MAKIPETFRCHVRMRGEQCPCEMTLVNTFTFSLKTLDQKTKAAGETTSTKTFASHAICPWHARYLAKLRRDIVRMDGVVSLLVRRGKYEREKAAARAEAAKRNQFHNRRFLGRQPALGAALIQAGIRT